MKIKTKFSNQQWSDTPKARLKKARSKLTQDYLFLWFIYLCKTDCCGTDCYIWGGFSSIYIHLYHISFWCHSSCILWTPAPLPVNLLKWPLWSTASWIDQYPMKCLNSRMACSIYMCLSFYRTVSPQDDFLDDCSSSNVKLLLKIIRLAPFCSTPFVFF